MSEQEPIPNESLEKQPSVEDKEEHKSETKKSSEAKSAAEQAPPSVEALHKTIEHESKRARDIHIEGPENNSQHYLATKELKKLSYERSLRRVQRHLGRGERLFSKFVHRAPVQSLSEAVGITVGRPTGLLIGSLSALIGSTLLLFAAKHYGFKYNFLVFLLIFAAGYILGCIIELTIRLFRQLRH